jgi:hypothetical protein
MNLIKMMVALSLLVVGSSIALAETTVVQTIAKTHYNEAANVAYVVGTGKWSGTSCPNATYVTINPAAGNPSGVGQMLSIILAAQFAGKSVSFLGACDTNPDFFVAFYVIVQ